MHIYIHSDHFGAVCKAGYSGTGSTESCSECPSDTYKSSAGDQDCVAIPANASPVQGDKTTFSKFRI